MFEGAVVTHGRKVASRPSRGLLAVYHGAVVGQHIHPALVDFSQRFQPPSFRRDLRDSERR